MGGCPSRRSFQFEPTCSPPTRHADQPESSSVGALDASRLLHDGRDARNVVPSPDGRDEGQEPEVRAPGLCEPDQSKQHNLHASRDQEEEAGQSICLLGGVRGVRIKDELHLQDGRQESKGQGQDGLLQSSGGVSPNPDTGPQSGACRMGAKGASSSEIPTSSRLEDMFAQLIPTMSAQSSQVGNALGQMGHVLQELSTGQAFLLQTLQDTAINQQGCIKRRWIRRLQP